MSHLESDLTAVLGVSFMEECRRYVRNDHPNDIKPKDVKHSISMTLENFCANHTVTLKAEKKLPCKDCNAQGVQSITQMCPTCKGSGWLWNNQRQVCGMCKGRGMKILPCTACKGLKATVIENVFKIVVPKGSFNGAKIRLPGKGDNLMNDPNKASDIVCTVIEKPHPKFKRVYNDLYLVKTISYKQAICGCQFSVQHVDRRKLCLTIGAGEVTRPGSYKFAKNQGMPKQNSAKRGNLIILFDVKFPEIMIPSNIPFLNNILPEDKPTEKLHEEHEVCKLVKFDPKEQIYTVPYQQAHAYSDKSPMKTKKFDEIPGSCTSQ